VVGVFGVASKCTNFYKIPISSLGAMPQKQNYFEVRATWAAKNFYILMFLGWIFFHKLLTTRLLLKFSNINNF
jgi:hypothetical protein